MTDRTMPAPGPEMDALVNKAAGLVTGKPSQMDSAALGALEAWREQHEGSSWTLDYYNVLDRYSCHLELPPFGSWNSQQSSLAVAICHAIVRASREMTR